MRRGLPKVLGKVFSGSSKSTTRTINTKLILILLISLLIFLSLDHPLSRAKRNNPRKEGPLMGRVQQQQNVGRLTWTWSAGQTYHHHHHYHHHNYYLYYPGMGSAPAGTLPGGMILLSSARQALSWWWWWWWSARQSLVEMKMMMKYQASIIKPYHNWLPGGKTFYNEWGNEMTKKSKSIDIQNKANNLGISQAIRQRRESQN